MDTDIYLVVRDGKYLYFLDLATHTITKVGVAPSGYEHHAFPDNIIQVRDENNLKLMWVEYQEGKQVREVKALVFDNVYV